MNFLTTFIFRLTTFNLYLTIYYKNGIKKYLHWQYAADCTKAIG